MRNRNSVVIATLILGAFTFTSALHAQEGAGLSVKDVVAKVSHARQQLRTGSFRFSVESSEAIASKGVRDTPKDGEKVFSEESEKWSGVCRFDLVADSYLMHYTQSGDLYKMVENASEEMSFITMLNPDGYWVHDGTRNRAAFLLFDRFSSDPRGGLRKSPLVPHAIGLIDLKTLVHGGTLDSALADLVVTAKHAAAPQVIDDPANSDQFVVRQLYHKGRLRRETFFSRSKGWVPVKQTLKYLFYDRETNEFLNKTELNYESTTEWKISDGVSLPTKYTQISYRNHDSRRPGIESDVIDVKVRKNLLTLEWEEVNTEFSDEVFDYHKIGLPSGTNVVDTRGSRPVP